MAVPHDGAEKREAWVATGRSIRRRREQRALTLDDVQKATGIPTTHLQAIEDGRLDDLPAGPYRKAFVQQVRAHLELDRPDPPRDAPAAPDEPEDVVQVAERVEASPTDDAGRAQVPLWIVRRVAQVAAVGLVVLGVRQFTSVTLPAVEKHLPAPPIVPPDPPDLNLVLTVQQAAPIVVRVDGTETVSRRFAPGERIEAAGRERVEIELPRVEAVKISYNGISVTPQGRQDEPRTVRFIDDLRPGK